MSKFLKSAALAGAAMAASVSGMSAPASAQVNGIATSNPTIVIVRSAARQAAYTQIQQTYAAQIQQVNQFNTELQTLQRSLDTNNDQQVSQAEVDANPGVIQQIQAKEQQIAQSSQPIAMAQYYVIEQLLGDYGNARNQVIQDKNISVMIAPDALQYGPEGIDVTADIVAAMDARLPTVSTAVPQGWQPRQQTAQMHQSVQQILLVAAQQAAAAQAQQQQQQGNTQAPSGR